MDERMMAAGAALDEEVGAFERADDLPRVEPWQAFRHSATVTSRSSALPSAGTSSW
jgi:hypothetical protein